jgi:hypothetical protein
MPFSHYITSDCCEHKDYCSNLTVLYSTLKTEAVGSYKMLIAMCKTTQHHFPEIRILNVRIILHFDFVMKRIA